ACLGTALNERTLSATEGSSTAPTKMDTMRPRESGAASRFVMSAIGFRINLPPANGVPPQPSGLAVKRCDGLVCVVAKADSGEQALATNRKAFFHYEVLERAEAGIVLVGTEVKSIRAGGLEFKDAYVEPRGSEMLLVGCRIAPYSHGNLMNHAPDRSRKLLLHKREIVKLGTRATERGLTILPLRAYWKNGRVKVEIGLARGKKAHDKREAIKKKDQEREARQEMSRRNR